MTSIRAISRAKGVKKGKSKTPGLKYSSSLNEKPIGSFSLISPDTMNTNPVRARKNWVSRFMSSLNESLQRQRSSIYLGNSHQYLR